MRDCTDTDWTAGRQGAAAGDVGERRLREMATLIVLIAERLANTADLRAGSGRARRGDAAAATWRSLRRGSAPS